MDRISFRTPTVTLSRLGRWPCLLAILVGCAHLAEDGVHVPLASAQPKPSPPRLDASGDLFSKLGEARQRRAEDSTAPMPRLVIPKKSDGTIPPEVIKGMAWRSIGPANMGGRVTALAIVESDPTTFYIATATGGLLKTVNNGITFEHLFDREATVSIGDVAVAASDPAVVWVGTGENNPRNSVSYGDGVYKSTDAGKTWKSMGLAKTFQIGKVLIHPTNPEIVYVGALGRLYGPNDERGLFKTTDGGKTWKRILFHDDRTGIIDMRFDPFDPETLLVATWDRKRDEHDAFFGGNPPVPDMYGPIVTYGPGAGLHRSTDGGANWIRLSDPDRKSGLPTVKLGRIGLDFSRKTKGLVYAIIDSEKVGTGPPPSPVFLGIVGRNMEDRKGAKITEVVEDGPSDKAGLKTGDIIKAIDGMAVENYEDFIENVRSRKPGDKLKLEGEREGKPRSFEVTLGSRPGAATDSKTPTPTLGIQLGKSGLKISEVLAGGAAAVAGMKAGDVIQSINGKTLDSPQDLLNALRTFKVGARVKIVVQRDEETKDLQATLGTSPAAKKGPSVSRPYGLGLGGQQPNAQNSQGKDGFQTGGVFTSKDGGLTWNRVNSLNPRPMYFSQIRVDPTDDSIYVLGDIPLHRSTDAGKTFKAVNVRGIHPDHHALWINPANGRHLVIGTDGGAYATYDRAANWDHLSHLALGQFYHIAVDNRTPYRVYGGLQDNGSWGGPSRTLRSNGPVPEDWAFVNGGDGFVCRVDPNDPDLVYAETQNGGMVRRNLRTGERAFIRPKGKNGETLRFNWNTPFILSHHNAGVVYSAAQYVFRSVKRGEDAKMISPEITRSKKGSGTALAESPRTPDVLWAGTDEGDVWLTRDGGTMWMNMTPKIEAAGLPGPRWVASLEASRAKDGRCYICFDGHRSNDDRPWIFVTENFGTTWTSISANLPAFGSTRVLREDITNPDLLYLGTEFGIWASANRGASWTKLNNNLPTVPVHEIAQPTTASEIVVGTHGRSLWILDVASLRQLNPTTLAAEATLFTPATAVRWRNEPGGETPFTTTPRRFVGTNPPRGATLDYLLTTPARSLSLKVEDATGQIVREFRSAAKSPGFHRQTWDLTQSGGGATLVPAGTYRAVLTVDGKTTIRPITLVNDPHADPQAVIAIDSREAKDEDEEDDDEESERWVRDLNRESREAD